MEGVAKEYWKEGVRLMRQPSMIVDMKPPEEPVANMVVSICSSGFAVVMKHVCSWHMLTKVFWST